MKHIFLPKEAGEKLLVKFVRTTPTRSEESGKSGNKYTCYSYIVDVIDKNGSETAELRLFESQYKFYKDAIGFVGADAVCEISSYEKQSAKTGSMFVNYSFTQVGGKKKEVASDISVDNQMAEIFGAGTNEGNVQVKKNIDTIQAIERKEEGPSTEKIIAASWAIGLVHDWAISEKAVGYAFLGNEDDQRKLIDRAKQIIKMRDTLASEL